MAEDVLHPGRDAKAIADIQAKKLEVRDRLRAARAEMKQLDIHLINAGAHGADLVAMCW